MSERSRIEFHAEAGAAPTAGAWCVGRQFAGDRQAVGALEGLDRLARRGAEIAVRP